MAQLSDLWKQCLFCLTWAWSIVETFVSSQLAKRRAGASAASVVNAGEDQRLVRDVEAGGMTSDGEEPWENDAEWDTWDEEDPDSRRPGAAAAPAAAAAAAAAGGGGDSSGAPAAGLGVQTSASKPNSGSTTRRSDATGADSPAMLPQVILPAARADHGSYAAGSGTDPLQLGGTNSHGLATDRGIVGPLSGSPRGVISPRGAAQRSGASGGSTPSAAHVGAPSYGATVPDLLYSNPAGHAGPSTSASSVGSDLSARPGGGASAPRTTAQGLSLSAMRFQDKAADIPASVAAATRKVAAAAAGAGDAEEEPDFFGELGMEAEVSHKRPTARTGRSPPPKGKQRRPAAASSAVGPPRAAAPSAMGAFSAAELLSGGGGGADDDLLGDLEGLEDDDLLDLDMGL